MVFSLYIYAYSYLSLSDCLSVFVYSIEEDSESPLGELLADDVASASQDPWLQLLISCWLVVGGWRLAVGWWLLGEGRRLEVGGWWLAEVGCWWLEVGDWWLWLAAGRWLLVVVGGCWLVAAGLPVGWWLVCIVSVLMGDLRITHCIMTSGRNMKLLRFRICADS